MAAGIKTRVMGGVGQRLVVTQLLANSAATDRNTILMRGDSGDGLELALQVEGSPAGLRG